MSRLAVDATVGVTDLVEDMHRSVAHLAPPLGLSAPGRMGGLTGFVYRRVRGVTRAAGRGLDAFLAQIAPYLDCESEGPRRDALRAVVNGVVGDHLAATGNPLAIPMQLRHGRRPLALDRHALRAQFGPRHDRLLVLVHGLCMNDLGWTRDGHDHGTALARELRLTPVYLRYNSGRSIAENGRDFAALLDTVLQTWPVPVREISILGHSMGGLVARSACHYGAQADHAWLPALKHIVFLGTPHHGAPPEQAGSLVDQALGMSPYTAPFARLGLIRSAAIQDLRHGTILDEQERGRRPSHVPLAEGVACFAVAATRQTRRGDALADLPGDGLVSVCSALARCQGPAQSLSMPDAHQYVGYGLHHFDLLSSRVVFERIVSWLSDARLGASSPPH
ncbi:MAG: alpha/beta hydrolase [Bacteroidota bacterium]